MWLRGLLLMQVARATSVDLPAIESLLTASGLPLDGVAEAFETGIVAREGDAVIGAAAVEIHADGALLRSVVVADTFRGSGIGRRLVLDAEALARDRGATDVYLLTETAGDYFPRLGYARLERDDVPAGVQRSVEFTTACATTAVAMMRSLR